MTWDKAIGPIGIVFNIAGAIIIDRVTVHGAQLTGYMNSEMIAGLMRQNQRREGLRKLGWRLMLVGFTA